MQTRTLATLLSVSLLAAAARAQEFQPGDLWIVSQGIQINTGTGITPGISRVDATAGSAQIVVPVSSTMQAHSTFDRYRNAIVTSFTIGATIPSFELRAVKADGTHTSLGAPASGLTGVASANDGRIYYFAQSLFPHCIRYIDAANVVHPLLDVTGTVPFAPSMSNFERAMYFDAETNSLFLGSLSFGPCGTTLPTAVLLKIPLSADGTRVAGPVQSASICITSTASDSKIVNFSEGPAGTLFVVLDDNLNESHGRMVVVDKTTLAYSIYASNGPYTGAAATVAGVYSHKLGCAVIDDGFDARLRKYTLGESGLGVTWFTGDGLSLHADASMNEIPLDLATGLAPYGTGTPGCKGAQALYANGTPQVGAANFRFTCTNAPASALGLLIVGNVPDPIGTDPFGFGALLNVNLFASTFLTGLDIVSDASGFGSSPAPIPILPTFVGTTVDAQALWVWSGCATPSPFGIGTSTGLAVTFQP